MRQMALNAEIAGRRKEMKQRCDTSTPPRHPHSAETRCHDLGVLSFSGAWPLLVKNPRRRDRRPRRGITPPIRPRTCCWRTPKLTVIQRFRPAQAQLLHRALTLRPADLPGKPSAVRPLRFLELAVQAASSPRHDQTILRAYGLTAVLVTNWFCCWQRLLLSHFTVP